jgi:uncharacterized protein (TIGR02186 family)
MLRWLVLMFLILLPLNAQAQDLSVEIASDHIDITVGFNGSRIEIFGDRRDLNTDIAVFVTGPEREMTVWRKVQILGAWINLHYAHFYRQPGYYNYAVSFDEAEEGTHKALMLENRIGLEGLFHTADVKLSGRKAEKQNFTEALIAQKQRQGAYPQQAAEMKFINPHFFRVSFDIPATAPTGQYKIHSFLIRDGKVIEADIDNLNVQQVGTNAFVLYASKNYSLVYALFCIIIAAGSGWLMSSLRLRP